MVVHYIRIICFREHNPSKQTPLHPMSDMQSWVIISNLMATTKEQLYLLKRWYIGPLHWLESLRIWVDAFLPGGLL